MSLVVWLPLTKDLRNQGLSDLTFSITNSTETTVDNNGKLGKCYSQSSLSGSGGLISNKTIDLGQNQSMFCWFKFVDLTSSSSLGGGLVSQHRYPSNQGMGITIRYVSSTTGYLSVNTGNGSSRTYNNYYGTTLLQANTWYHGGYTYDGSTLKIYVNGNCEKTQAITGMSVPADYISCFNWSMASTSGASLYGGYKLHGSLNDVRIYDHCLSPMEVKQLSQGLVLHYPLNRNGWGQENLLSRYVVPGQAAPTSTAAGGRTTWLGDYKITIPATENADTYFRLFTTKQLTANATYTISCKVDGLLDGTYYRFPLYAQGNTAMGVLTLDHNGLCSLTFTMTYGTQTAATGANGETVYICFMDDSARAIASGQGAITISNFKLEEGSVATPWCPNSSDTLATTMGLNGTTEYDCSGFCNNGTKNNSPTYSSDTAKYEVSTHVDGVNQTIQLPNLLTLIPDSIFTFNIWFKRLSTEPSSKPWETLFGGPSGFEIETCSANNVHDNKIKAYSWGGGTFEFELDEWNMLTMVSNGTNALFYLNSELKLTGTYKALVSGNYFLGSWSNTSTQNYKGYLSDARIYATALSADDVKSLYQNCATIDADGTIHGQIRS